jgi:predicted ester cyclase
MAMTFAEENKALVRAFFDAANAGDISLAGTFFSQEFVDHEAPPGVTDGPEGARQFLSIVLATIPDLRLTVDDMIAEGDKVAVRITVDGTMKGAYKGLAPTGNHATWKGVDIYTIAGGKIVERWVVRDHLSMMRQWGILSLP